MWWNDIRKVFENLMTKETYSNTVWELKKTKTKAKNGDLNIVVQVMEFSIIRTVKMNYFQVRWLN